MSRPHEGAQLQLSLLSSETLVWQRGPVIGTGRFGEVVLALRIPSAECIAVKQIYIQEEIEIGNDTSSLCMQRMLPLAKIEREVDIVQSLHHPNIVQFFGCDRHGPVYRMFMEYVPLGSLGRVIREMGPFKEIAARHVVRQVLDGVAYLHRLGVAHRDLKCGNLLLAADGTVKISDFGAATRATGGSDTEHEESCEENALLISEDVETARSVRDGLGSPFWMAPELVRAECGVDGWRKADIWGVGCVLIELLTAKPPWENHSNPLTAMFHIASKEALPPFPPSLSASARSFLESCFQKDPAARPSPEALLQHPFISGEKGLEGKNTVEERATKDPKLRLTHSAANGEGEVGTVAVRDDSARSLCVLENQEEDCVRPGMLTSRLDAVVVSAIEDSNTREECSSSDDEADVAAYSSDGNSDHVEEQELSDGNADHVEEGELSGRNADHAVKQELTESPRVIDPNSVIEQSDSHAVETTPERDEADLKPLGRVRALASYLATESNELSLGEGDTLLVTGVNAYGWWQGFHEHDLHRAMGWFPCTYAEWIPRAESFEVLVPHDPPERDDCLLLRVHDHVNVLRTEWRNDRLWGFGTTAGGDITGWFPFSCIHPGSK